MYPLCWAKETAPFPLRRDHRLRWGWTLRRTCRQTYQDGKTDLAVMNRGDITDFPTQTLMVFLGMETAASHR